MVELHENINDPKSVTVVKDKDDLEKVDLVKPSEIVFGAQKATDNEHRMTLMDGIRKYPKAAFWSIWFSTALIGEGFDHAFTGGFFAFPEFMKRYGVLESDGTYQIPATWQSAIGNGVSAGEIVGLLINGIVSDRFGYRWVMICSLILMIGFVFLQFFATSIRMYLCASILLGLPWGVFQTLTTAYASEVCPLVLRPYLTMLVSLCWSIGYLIGSGALRGFLGMKGEWAYRIPFALQWVWPIPLMIGIYLAPESPWWLIRRGRNDEALAVVRRLLSNPDEEDDEAEDTVAMMIHTNKIEQEMKAASTYWDCFKGIDLRRTEIAIITYLIQEFCAPIVSNATYFLEQAGLPATDSFDFSCGQYGLAILGVFLAWWAVSYHGRRTLLLSGTTFVLVTLFVIGFLGIPSPETHPSISWGIGGLLLVQYFVFFITVGPVVYTIVSEIPSNFLRAKTIVLARAFYNVLCIVYGQLTPRMIQKAAWNWGAKCGFFFGGFLFISLVWAYFRLPETKDRTFAEIDLLFKNKIAARKFSSTSVDIASEQVIS